MRNGLRFEILRRDNFTCRYCGASAPDVVLNVDHVVPVSKGGTDDPLNLVTACFGCNHGKFTKRLTDASTLAATTAEGEQERMVRERETIARYVAENRQLQKEQRKLERALVKLWNTLTPARPSVYLDESDMRSFLAKNSLEDVEQALRSAGPKVNTYYIRDSRQGAKKYIWGILRLIAKQRAEGEE